MQRVKKEDLTPNCNYYLEGEEIEVTLVEVFDNLAVVESDYGLHQFEVPVSKLYKLI